MVLENIDIAFHNALPIWRIPIFHFNTRQFSGFQYGTTSFIQQQWTNIFQWYFVLSDHLFCVISKRF